MRHSGKLSRREVLRHQARCGSSKIEGGACPTFLVIPGTRISNPGQKALNASCCPLSCSRCKWLATLISTRSSVLMLIWHLSAVQYCRSRQKVLTAMCCTLQISWSEWLVSPTSIWTNHAMMLSLCLSAGLAARNASVAQGRTGDGVKTEKEGVNFGKIIQSGLNGPLTEALASYYVVSEQLTLLPCSAFVKCSSA